MPTLAHAAWPTDPHINLPIPALTAPTTGPSIAADAQGGAYISGLIGAGQPALQHVTAQGAIDPAWPPAGLDLGSASPAATQAPMLAPDGAHGVLATWRDGNCLRVSRVDLTGHVVAGWPDSGLVVCSGETPTAQATWAACSDWFGGVIVAWFDAGNASRNVICQRVRSNGAVDPGWPATFATLHSGAEALHSAVLVPDGLGGAYFAWSEDIFGVGNIVADHVHHFGVHDPRWGTNGITVCGAAGAQTSPALVTEDLGGIYVAWQDERANPGQPVDDIYFARVNLDGSRPSGWPLDGRLVCDAAGAQTGVALASDDSGGVYLAWSDGRGADRDIYAARRLRTGEPVVGWPAQGAPVCVGAQDQGPVRMVRDARGAAIVTWADLRNGNADQYAQRVLPSGAVDPAWTLNGAALTLAAGAQTLANVTEDGAGGVIAAWSDGRNAQPAIFAQRVANNGALGGNVVVGVSPAPLAGGAGELRAVPNPARGAVDLRFRQPAPGQVRLAIYDLRGRLVRGLEDAALPAGERVVRWDGRDAQGRAMPPGVYLARLRSASGAVTRRIVLVGSAD